MVHFQLTSAVCKLVYFCIPNRSPSLIGYSADSGSSSVGEDSLSHHGDKEIGVYVIDRMTYFTLDFLEKVQPNSKATLSDLFK